MFRPKPGVVFLESKSDPRWNFHIRLDGIMFAIGPPKILLNKKKELTQKYGKPPNDLEWGGMKD